MAESIKPATAEASPYLKQVRVRDYPPLRDAKVSFKPGLNIIIGKNGAGKTRLLNLVSHLIELYQGGMTVGAGCELILGGRYEINVSFKESSILPIELNNSMQYAVTKPLQMLVRVFEGELVISESNTLFGALAPINSLINHLTFFVQHSIPHLNFTLLNENINLNISKSNFSINVGSEVVNKIQGSLFKSLLHSINVASRNALMASNDFEHKFLVDNGFIKNLIKQMTNFHLNYIKNYIISYTPLQDIRLNELFQVYHDNNSDEFVVKGLGLEYKIGDSWLPFSSLSDGTKRLCYIITEILSPTFVEYDIKKGDYRIQKSSKTVLLEEPELGIHHSQLHKLLQLIREVSRESQVIMT